MIVLMTLVALVIWGIVISLPFALIYALIRVVRFAWKG